MRILTALAAAAVMAMPASAVTIFSQNFDTVPRANNTTNVPGFTVTGGVDVISSGVIYHFRLRHHGVENDSNIFFSVSLGRS